MAANKECVYATDDQIKSMTVKELKDYLRRYGQFLTGHKSELINRAMGVRKLKLVDKMVVEVGDNAGKLETREEKLRTPLGEKIPEPNGLENWSRDVSLIPDLCDNDIYNYLVLEKGARRQHKSDRSAWYVADHHVHNVEYNQVSESCSHCVVRCLMIPSLPKKNEPDHVTWVCLSKVSGKVNSGDCGCTAGMSAEVKFTGVLVLLLAILVYLFSWSVFIYIGVIFLVLLAYVKWHFGTAVYCHSFARLDGKTVLVTGGNAGCGLETAVDMATRGARVILGCRNEERAEKAAQIIKERSGNSDVVYYILDLADFDSIRQFAKQILDNESRLDILINNAGIGRSAVYHTVRTTKQGHELIFGTNYLGPFLLTYLLLDLLKKSAPSQIINLSSIVHYFMWKQLVLINGKTDADPYPASKIGNIMHARELAKQFKGINRNALFEGTKTTKQGHELVFGTNYLGPFLLTSLLLDLLKKSAPSQIINLSSNMHYIVWDRLVLKKPLTCGNPYSASKIGNIMHAIELATRYKGTVQNIVIN